MRQIFERTGKIAKSHSGVRSEFARLLKDVQGIDRELPKFLGQSYKYKEVSDYGIGPSVHVSQEEAMEAINNAVFFVEFVYGLVKDQEA